MRAAVVSVDYAGELALSLPRNAPHFERTMVVTSPFDLKTQAVAMAVAEYLPGKIELHVTDVFYRDGATFNKGRALSEALSRLVEEDDERHAEQHDGWLAVFDADTIIPAAARIQSHALPPGNLYGPRRRMLRNPAEFRDGLDWSRFPLNMEDEFPGFLQIWHKDDPAVRGLPLYPENWAMANCDSEHQSRWPKSRRVRLPFEVLHLGEDGRNWCGRTTPWLDGTVPEKAEARAAKLKEYLRQRNHGRGSRAYDAEKIVIPRAE